MPCKPSDRLACPSLESSPFSSPASMELTAVSCASSVAISTNALPVRSGNYYLPAFTLNAHGKLSSTGNGVQSVTTSLAQTPSVSMVNVPLLVRSNQMLPSVDTLLFTNQTGGSRFFAGKSATAATPHLTWSGGGICCLPTSTPQRSPVS